MRFLFSLFSAFLLLHASLIIAQLPAASGTFVLHKFAQPIGKETYAIAINGDSYTLSDHFLFTDRSTPVPLEPTFTAHTVDMMPVKYEAKGKSSRLSPMVDTIRFDGGMLTESVNDKERSVTPSGAWFVTDGYSPVAMQKQMMRWWLSHAKPSVFTVYPAAAQVRIVPAGDATVEGHTLHGYTVSGLIWGQEKFMDGRGPQPDGSGQYRCGVRSLRGAAR
jgi:hypothetical protein